MVVKRQQHLTDSTWGQRAYPLILTPNPAAPLSWWAPGPLHTPRGYLFSLRRETQMETS